MTTVLIIKRSDDFKELRKQIEFRWLELETMPSTFRYKLNIQKQKTITNGPYNILMQLNIERSTKRRQPQQMSSLAQPFDPNTFNFNKVNESEILIKCNYRLHNQHETDGLITFLINSSPLTKYHSLICPNLNGNLSQILTKQSICFAIDVLQSFDDKYYRIGYNSLGAFASVNHLHLHLMYIETDLFIENVELEHVVGNVYKIGGQYPVFGICFVIHSNENNDIISSDIMKMIDYFCDNCIPHNLLWTFAPYGERRIIKVFIYPRSHMSDKTQSGFNVAFCELSGYVPIGDSEVFEALTGDILNSEIRKAMGSIDDKHLMSEIIRLYSD